MWYKTNSILDTARLIKATILRGLRFRFCTLSSLCFSSVRLRTTDPVTWHRVTRSSGNDARQFWGVNLTFASKMSQLLLLFVGSSNSRIGRQITDLFSNIRFYKVLPQRLSRWKPDQTTLPTVHSATTNPGSKSVCKSESCVPSFSKSKNTYKGGFERRACITSVLTKYEDYFINWFLHFKGGFDANKSLPH